MHHDTIIFLSGSATAIVAVAAVLHFAFIRAKHRAYQEGYDV